MNEILHQLGWMKPYEDWDMLGKSPTHWLQDFVHPQYGLQWEEAGSPMVCLHLSFVCWVDVVGSIYADEWCDDNREDPCEPVPASW